MVADKDGNIPLLCAIEIGNVPVARELLLSHTQEQSCNEDSSMFLGRAS